MTVKQFARVKRAEAARALAIAARSTPLGNVNWVGYYDQAHFIKDFKALTGSTPGKWIR
jgi:AraC-like DNA-binding protein